MHFTVGMQTYNYRNTYKILPEPQMALVNSFCASTTQAMALAHAKKHTMDTYFLSLHMCSRNCKHNYRITIIVKVGYHDHSPAGLVVTGVPLARDDMHSPRAIVKHAP